MRIAAFSDTHNLHEGLRIPNCNLLLVAGDITGNGSSQQLIKFYKWLETVSFNKCLIIAGNHDSICELSNDLSRLTPPNCTYLCNESVILENGMKLYATPYTPEFMNWHFMYPREEMYDKVWKYIPDDTEVLFTHGPAYGILDKIPDSYVRNNEDAHVGCKGLLKRISELKKLKHVIFGHIHMETTDKKKIEINGVTYYNVSVCNNAYERVNSVTIINI